MSTQGRNYWHTDSERDLEWLENVIRTAREQGTSLRLYTADGRLSVKRGGGMWSGDLLGTFDTFRDEQPSWVIPEIHQPLFEVIAETVVRECDIEFGEHDHDDIECARTLDAMSGDDGDDGSWDREQYNRDLEEQYLGRPLFPNEY